MKVKRNIGLFRFACIAVLCAGVAFFVSTCKDDDEEVCKTCEHKTIEDKTELFCGDDLKEAQRSDSDWKNCK